MDAALCRAAMIPNTTASEKLMPRFVGWVNPANVNSRHAISHIRQTHGLRTTGRSLIVDMFGVVYSTLGVGVG